MGLTSVSGNQPSVLPVVSWRQQSHRNNDHHQRKPYAASLIGRIDARESEKSECEGVERSNFSIDLWFAEEGILHGLFVRIPVEVIIFSLLFDVPNLIQQFRIRNGKLEAGA
jgi:hypothetical protein